MSPHLRALQLVLGSLLASAVAFAQSAGQFQPAASMNAARWAHTMTALPDGRVLAAGGVRDNATQLNSAEIYDPASNAWTVVPPMRTPHSYHRAVRLLDGRVLVAGGQGYNRIAEVYDAASNSWTATSQMSDRRFTEDLVPFPDGGIAAVRGSTDNLCVEWLDVASLTWSAPVCAGRTRFDVGSAPLDDGRILVVGARVDTSEVVPSIAELFDASTSQWSPAAAPAVRQVQPELERLPDGRIFAACGALGAEVYSPDSGQWNAASPWPIGCTTADVLPDGTVLTLATNEGAARYDSVKDRWAFAGKPEHYRTSHATAVLEDGGVLVSGGSEAPTDGGSEPMAIRQAEIWTALEWPEPEGYAVDTEQPKYEKPGCGCSESALAPLALGAVALVMRAMRARRGERRGL